MVEQSSALEKTASPKISGHVSFVAIVTAHERYLSEQCDLGNVSAKQLEEFREVAKDLKTRYEMDREKTIREFNHAREKVLQDTGIELLKERTVAEFQKNLYDIIGVDRYTYRNGAIMQFLKGIVDAALFDTVEIVTMLRDQWPAALLQMFSWETLRQILPSVGHAFSDLATGDAYMRWRSVMQVACTTLGAVGVGKLLLKAGGRALSRAALTSGKIWVKRLERATITRVEEWSKKSVRSAEKIPHTETGKHGIFEFQPGSGTLMIREIHWNTEEMKKYLIDTIVKYNPEIVKFAPDISHEAKRAFSGILAHNYPLLEVARLVPGHEVVNINFRGIKKLNDAYGQAFVDGLLATFKKDAIARFDSHNLVSSAKHSRLVRNEYKNITFSVPEEFNPLEILSSGKSKQDCIDAVIRSNRERIVILAKEQKVPIGQIEQRIRENFDFEIGTARVPKTGKPEDLMRAFYEAEMATPDTSGGILRIARFDPGLQSQLAEQVLWIERGFLKRWEGTRFSFEWMEYPMSVPTAAGEQVIHPKLLQAVRKWGSEIDPVVHGEVRRYIDTLNRGFDFIAPFRNFEKDFWESLKISRDFHDGRIQTRHLMTNYKDVLTKEAFFAFAEGRKGMKIFIDIKDMGIQNLASFRSLAGKVTKGEHSFKDLLGAGGDVTDKFAYFVRELGQKYPNAKFSLGGDEVNIFVEGMGKKEANAALRSINATLSHSKLEGRVTHSFEKKDLRSVFSWLDELTKVNKEIEKSLREKAITTHVDVARGVTESEALRAIGSREAKSLLDRVGKWMVSLSEKIRVHLPWGSDVSIACIAENGLYRFVFSK